MSANDSGPVVALAWGPLSTETIWQGPAATAHGTLEQGSYFAADHIVGVTGQGVLVTEESTGQSTYFLAIADEVQQHLADVSYQVLTAVPDAYEWTALGIHDAMAYEDEVVIGVRTIDASHHTFQIGAAGTASIGAIRAVQGNRPAELPDPVHIGTAYAITWPFWSRSASYPAAPKPRQPATTASQPPAAS